jgi:hypothetical protein
MPAGTWATAQTATLGIIYAYDRIGQKPASETDKVNFALKFLVRPVAGNKAGSPTVITISFPMVHSLANKTSHALLPQLRLISPQTRLSC